MNVRLSTLALPLVLHAACTSGGGARLPATSPNSFFTGSSANDVWAFGNKLEHFDGTAWKDVPVVNVSGAVSAAPGVLLATVHTPGQAQQVLRVDASGTVTTVTPPAPKAPAVSEAGLEPFRLFRGRSSVVAIYSSSAGQEGRVEQVYRWESDHFVEVPTPAAPWYAHGDRALAVFAADDAWFNVEVTLDLTYDRGLPRVSAVHFDGKTWAPAYFDWVAPTETGEGMMMPSLVSSSFPKESGLIGGLSFDGARFHPLGLPGVGGAGSISVWSSSGRVATIAQFAGSGETPLGFQEVTDANGNVVGSRVLDLRGYVDVRYELVEWDPASSAWLSTQTIGTTKQCVGIGCAYGGGVIGVGLRAELADGTLLVMLNPEGEGKPFFLQAVKP